jgi:hypothetical protein
LSVGSWSEKVVVDDSASGLSIGVLSISVGSLSVGIHSVSVQW